MFNHVYYCEQDCCLCATCLWHQSQATEYNDAENNTLTNPWIFLSEISCKFWLTCLQTKIIFLIFPAWDFNSVICWCITTWVSVTFISNETYISHGSSSKTAADWKYCGQISEHVFPYGTEFRVWSICIFLALNAFVCQATDPLKNR